MFGVGLALRDLVARGGGLRLVREDHLVQLALFGRAVLVLMLVEIGLGVGVRDLIRLGDLGRQEGEQRRLGGQRHLDATGNT